MPGRILKWAPRLPSPSRHFLHNSLLLSMGRISFFFTSVQNYIFWNWKGGGYPQWNDIRMIRSWIHRVCVNQKESLFWVAWTYSGEFCKRRWIRGFYCWPWRHSLWKLQARKWILLTTTAEWEDAHPWIRKTLFPTNTFTATLRPQEEDPANQCQDS